MRIPGTAGHQQHRFMLKLAKGAGDIQRIGHHHQARLLAKLRDHGGGRTATVDDDPRMLTNPAHCSAGNGLLIGRHRLCLIGNQLLRQRDRTAIATQQQTISLKSRQVFADSDFRGLETFGQRIDTDLAQLIQQREDVVPSLWSVSFRHFGFKFRFVS